MRGKSSCVAHWADSRSRPATARDPEAETRVGTRRFMGLATQFTDNYEHVRQFSASTKSPIIK